MPYTTTDSAHGTCIFDTRNDGPCVADPTLGDADREERLADAAMVAAEATVRLCDACGKKAAQRRYSWPPQSSYSAPETAHEEFLFFCDGSSFDWYAYAEYFPDLTPNTTRWPLA